MPKNQKINGRKESLILRELTLILRNDFNNKALSAVSIAEVRLVNDNEIAKIYWNYLPISGIDLTKEKIAAALEDNKVRIRKELAHKIQFRSVPDLEFIYDDSLEHANHIEELLKKSK